MKNDLLTIGGFTIHGYGLMIGLGFVAAYFMTEYRASKQGLDSDKIISLAGWTIIAGLICAKLLYYVTIFDDIIANPKLLLDLGDGFVVYGGIIGGIFGGFLFTRVHKVPFFKYFDLVMPSVALAQGLGRMAVIWPAAATDSRWTARYPSCLQIQRSRRTECRCFRPSLYQAD